VLCLESVTSEPGFDEPEVKPVALLFDRLVFLQPVSGPSRIQVSLLGARAAGYYYQPWSWTGRTPICFPCVLWHEDGAPHEAISLGLEHFSDVRHVLWEDSDQERHEAIGLKTDCTELVEPAARFSCAEGAVSSASVGCLC
jgi:hypothetical protein